LFKEAGKQLSDIGARLDTSQQGMARSLAATDKKVQANGKKLDATDIRLEAIARDIQAVSGGVSDIWRIIVRLAERYDEQPHDPHREKPPSGNVGGVSFGTVHQAHSQASKPAMAPNSERLSALG
jgi:hypothetical protein